MKKRLNILHIINSLRVGGAETLLVNSLAPGGIQNQANNVLVYLQATSVLEERVDKNVEVICLNYTGLLSLPKTLLKLRKIIKDKEIDIVHSHLNPVSFYTHLVCPKQTPQLHTIHIAYTMDNATPKLKLYLEKVLYLNKKSTNVALLSKFTKDDFLSAIHFKGKYFILNNFVLDSFFRDKTCVYNAGYNKLKMVAVGRLDAQKNFKYLLEVFRHLKDKDITLDIYGDGDIAAYEKEIKELGVKIFMKGRHDNLAKVLPEYDLFIMPSKFEGFPLSVFEAMASGIPLMLSDIPPLKSIVNENAIYFELNNPEGTAKKITAVLQGEIDINKMAEKAQAYAAQIAKRDIYINNLLCIYNELLNPSGNFVAETATTV
ncbi:MAG: glycosyltransferase [Ferruginibacter sp.]